ncbi:TetR/AcrR family transcriptional regulator [Myxococcus sp. AB025B]|uniref:TetR/AcrR family transcriptional regulator n=1 Tax=Myxococcus sp. AB025B TaxID=2562794 RepID=UPI001890C96C|nr:TetR/AcrR family transcriptional regulator [Myxococcus sp. AB025B]
MADDARQSAPRPDFVARKPQQQRAKVRVDAVLQAAEGLLLESGLSAFSIPTLAERLEYPRSTIYKFFPTPQALLNELAERQLAALEAHLTRYAQSLLGAKDWREPMTRMVHAAADFYRAHPAAQVVLLSGPVSDVSFRAFESTIARLGTLARNLLATHGIDIPRGAPDIAALAVEFGTASLRMSFYLHGRMTDEYTQAAADVMQSFLAMRLGLPLR